ncbi:MAG: hypothetical protein DID92_2727744204 [Candidatus Nitrotoga sp. SPKER]|nr:MAG: hypothetical protein DID92_2727744204 [Candidatus Nitrotoga sp. SPKER]
MDFRTYQQIRTYCCNDLHAYLDLPGYDSMRKFWGKLNGQVGLIQREQQLAVSLHQCSDLTPRERAAAELLAVISNHRAIAWQREPEPPNGNKPAPPLEKIDVDALANQTRDAVRRYAAFLPEPERDVLLADCEVTLEAAPHVTTVREEASKKTEGDIKNPYTFELMQLRDKAIDYLPAAQNTRDRCKKLRTTPMDYARSLWATSRLIRSDATLTAVERAAAELLKAVCMWQAYDPSDPKLAGINPFDHREASMREIMDAAKTLAYVTGQKIQFDDTLLCITPTDAPTAVKMEAVPVTNPSGGDIEQTLIDEKIRTNKKIWDDSKLKALWEESILPGVTNKSLAKKHGVSRQRIAALIKTAKNKLSTKNSWQNSQHPPQIRVIKGKKY